MGCSGTAGTASLRTSSEQLVHKVELELEVGTKNLSTVYQYWRGGRGRGGVGGRLPDVQIKGIVGI